MTLRPLACLVVCAVLTLAACGRQAEDNARPAASPASPDELRADTFVHGGERAALVAYLRSVRQVPARKFAVEWNADVVQINREQAIDILQAVSPDGAQFRFTDGALARRLSADRILFLWGIALRRVVEAHADGDQWVVNTRPVSLPEVFKEADIDFDYPLDAHQVFAAYRPPAPPSAAARADAAPRFMPVAFINSASAAEGGGGPQVINLPNSFATSVNGIDLELGYQPIEGGLHFDIEARKQQSDVQVSIGSSGKGLAQGLFDTGSGMWDLRLRASGDVTGISASDSMSVSNQLQIHGAALGLLKTEFRNVNGRLKLQFIARRGESSEQWIEKLKIDIPIRFNIPVIVAGLPMVFQIGFDVIAQPALTTKNDTFDAEYDIPFSGNGNVSLDGSKFTVGGTLAADPHPLQTLASSIGVSAILVAIQAPRVGLGIGVFGATSVVYIDLVTSATLTSGGQLGLAPCRQFTLVTSINAGVDTKIAFDVPGLDAFLGNPLNEKLKEAGKAASLREEIFKKKWSRVDPDVPVCRTGGGDT